MRNNFQALEIYVQANFSSKRVCRCSHMHKASGRKINEVNKVSKLCFGAPEMFSASQNYLLASHPPKSGGFDAFVLQIPSLYVQVLCSKFSYKLSKFSFQIIQITIYAVKNLLQKDAVSHIITKFAVYANKMCK